VTLFTVFDGHGPHGAHVSHTVRELYHQHIATAYRDVVVGSKNESKRRASVGNDLMGDVFQRAARGVTDALVARAAPASALDISVSGTTAVAMLVCDRDVFLANVGDSRAVLATYAPHENRYVVRYETRDHKPEAPDERQRIESHNGRVYEWGTFRVWLQDVDMPGLAMSRSFGDAIATSIGVNSDPDVAYVGDKVVHGDAAHPSFAVLASDGVWEFMTTDECVALVANCLTEKKMTPQEACNALVAEATERWNKEEDVVDDITALVVCF
jgi:serine/threonine protein phosphatase PrpC